MSATGTGDVDPRTGLITLDEQACWAHLEAERVGRLAVAVGHHPDIFPVNYRVWDGKIVIRTEAGTKLAGAVLNRAVAFEIDQVDPDNHSGWSVVVSGEASEPERLEDIMELDDLELELWVKTSKSRYLVITPETVTGRELPSQSQSQ